MFKNVGTADRFTRLIAGLALLMLVFWGPQTNWGYAGLILIFTALAGFCPLYSVLGVRTCGYTKK